MARDNRERALNQIVTLKILAEDQRATEGERQAAKATMAKLRKKYDIPESEAPKPKQASRSDANAKAWFDFMSRQRYTPPQESAEQKRKREESNRRYHEEQSAKRAKAQREWEDRMRFKDAMGNPLTGDDLREAQRDPLGWASKQDQRTRQQKNDDMNDSFGQSHKRRICEPKLPYFDIGGEARRRNVEGATCVKCGRWLIRGEGAEYDADGYACCDTVPGPRNKKNREED